jgi:transcriptional repressor NrdR
MMNGIIKACEKRPVPMADIEKIVYEIERALNNMMEKEMESSLIGEYVMEHLKKIDDVAFVRFASVYRQFTDAESFREEIDKILGKGGKRQPKQPKPKPKGETPSP